MSINTKNTIEDASSFYFLCNFVKKQLKKSLPQIEQSFTHCTTTINPEFTDWSEFN